MYPDRFLIIDKIEMDDLDLANLFDGGDTFEHEKPIDITFVQGEKKRVISYRKSDLYRTDGEFWRYVLEPQGFSGSDIGIVELVDEEDIDTVHYAMSLLLGHRDETIEPQHVYSICMFLTRFPGTNRRIQKLIRLYADREGIDHRLYSIAENKDVRHSILLSHVQYAVDILPEFKGLILSDEACTCAYLKRLDIDLSYLAKAKSGDIGMLMRVFRKITEIWDLPDQKEAIYQLSVTESATLDHSLPSCANILRHITPRAYPYLLKISDKIYRVHQPDKYDTWKTLPIDQVRSLCRGKLEHLPQDEILRVMRWILMFYRTNKETTLESIASTIDIGRAIIAGKRKIETSREAGTFTKICGTFLPVAKDADIFNPYSY